MPRYPIILTMALLPAALGTAQDDARPVRLPPVTAEPIRHPAAQPARSVRLAAHVEPDLRFAQQDAADGSPEIPWPFVEPMADPSGTRAQIGDPHPDANDSGRAVPSGDRWTLADLERIALAENPTLAWAQSMVEAREGHYIQSGLPPNPRIGYSGEEMGSLGTAGLQGGFIRQELVTGGKLRLNRAVAGHEIEAAQRTLDMQRLRVLGDVRTAYFQMLAARRIVALEGELVAIAQETVEKTVEAIRADDIRPVERFRVENVLESARLEQAAARQRQRTAWRKLALVLGRPGMKPIDLVDRLDEPAPMIQWEEAVARLLGTSPELARAYAAVERARCAVRRAQVQWVPNIELQGGVLHDNRVGEALATAELSLPLPLFDRNQGNIHRAWSELSAAENEVRRVELELQDRLADAMENYVDAHNRATRYAERIVPNSRDAYGVAAKALEQLEIDKPTLLAAQREYVLARHSAVEAQRDLQIAAAGIESLLLSGGLRTR